MEDHYASVGAVYYWNLLIAIGERSLDCTSGCLTILHLFLLCTTVLLLTNFKCSLNLVKRCKTVIRFYFVLMLIFFICRLFLHMS